MVKSWGPLLNFGGGLVVPLLNFEGGPGVPRLNVRGFPGNNFKLWVGSRVPGPWVPRSRVLGSWSLHHAQTSHMADNAKEYGVMFSLVSIYSHTD